ncbi:MAG: type II/IV secretion system protein [Planctomycetes bacterium]|nr:type II/IV secretion system protein [Planctomycetota bacterium]NOG53831.1 Flp pilus assembly complex ATPase component TadA [Planctomycetota bacterium]
MARKRQKLGEILVSKGALSADKLEQGLTVAKGQGKKLGETLVELGFVKDAQCSAALADQFGIKFLDLDAPGTLEELQMDLVPEDLIKKHFVLPLSKSNGRLKLIIPDPLDLQLLDMLRFRLNCEIEMVLSPKSQIKSVIDNQFGGAGSAGMFDTATSLVTESIDVTMDKSVDSSIDITAGDDAPIIKLCNRIIIEAVRSRASDIHIEPMTDRVRLRYRIDGVCHVRDDLPKRMQNAVLARLKLMAGVNIAERRVPQDGRINMDVDGSQIDFRVSSCPAYHGESVVLRILRPESVRIGLENLGFEAENLDVFNRIIRRPNGIFLVTGPTGSGKTTTLYSALSVLNRPDRKIITAEDPVEYNFSGMNQCQVRDSIGLSFTTILRAMLRQAPNIILVGEIRDLEVAEVAIQAALTGHLVFSTLHTNDAPSAITRLIDMGVKPFLVASSIQAAMAQRLIRVLCQNCRAPDEKPDPKYLKLCDIAPEEQATKTIYKSVGCSKCGATGFKGRKGIFELMLLTSEIRQLAFERAPISQIRSAAKAAGMRPLLYDGKVKILNGTTTPAEIARVAQVSELID